MYVCVRVYVYEYAFEYVGMLCLCACVSCVECGCMRMCVCAYVAAVQEMAKGNKDWIPEQLKAAARERRMVRSDCIVGGGEERGGEERGAERGGQDAVV